MGNGGIVPSELVEREGERERRRGRRKVRRVGKAIVEREREREMEKLFVGKRGERKWGTSMGWGSVKKNKNGLGMSRKS